MNCNTTHYRANSSSVPGDPTYEALWNVLGLLLLVWLDRRFRLGFGRTFAVYVMIYTAGRGWIESLRIDAIELNNVLGLRWGVWMSIILFVGALVYFVVTGRRHRPPDTRETSPYVDAPAALEERDGEPVEARNGERSGGDPAVG